MTPRSLVRQIADAGGRVWLNGESVRVAANEPLPDAIVEQLRRDKPGVVEVLRLLPVCCECGANVLEPVIAWWGGRPVHLDCGERARRFEWKGAALSADACFLRFPVRSARFLSGVSLVEGGNTEQGDRTCRWSALRSDKSTKRSPARARCLWDQQLAGFGLRIRPSGVKVYVVTYRAGHGRQAPLRRYTIGRHGAPWTPEQARREAKRVLGEVAAGQDPAKKRQRSRQADKEAPMVRDVAEQWLAEHVEAKRKARTLHNYRKLLDGVILPALGAKKMTALSRADVARLHYARRATPYQANCVLRALGAMCAWAEGHGFLPEHGNPCRRVEKYKEHPRERFLSPRELYRLGRALRVAERCGAITPWAAAAIRLLLFVGARRSEILEARWEWVDLDRATLSLPDSKTGKKIIHLNPPALDALAGLPRLDGNPFIIAGGKFGEHLVNIGKAWLQIRKAALLNDVRLHDLRHSFASVAVAGGLTLPLIGGLLGHRQPQTTARYAHLAADPLKAAAELVGSRIAAAMAGGAKVIVATPLRKQ